MGFLSKSFNWIDTGSYSEPQHKSVQTINAIDVSIRGADDIRNDVRSGLGATDALSNSTVYACARVIGQGLAQVPCLLQRSGRNGGREAAIDHPLYDLLNRKPNDFQTSYDYRLWIGMQLVITGNAYSWVGRDERERPIELTPLAHGLVTATKGPDGVLYRLNGSPVPTANIWHIRGASWDAISGLPMMRSAASAISLARDLENFGAGLFRNGARPSGVLATPQSLTQEQHDALRMAWEEAQTGINNAHKTAILHSGMTFETHQTNANDAQFIEARRLQVEEICRAIGVNPLMIGHTNGSQSYASVEQQFLAHMMHTISPLHALFEQSAEAQLLTDREAKTEGYRVHLDSRSMMRGSAIDMANYVAINRQNGIITQNEGRDHLGMDRFDDPDADRLQPAVNLFGPATPPAE